MKIIADTSITVTYLFIRSFIRRISPEKSADESKAIQQHSKIYEFDLYFFIY